MCARGRGGRIVIPLQLTRHIAGSIPVIHPCSYSSTRLEHPSDMRKVLSSILSMNTLLRIQFLNKINLIKNELENSRKFLHSLTSY